jgi:putative transposase
LHGILVITDLAGALVGAQHAAPLPSHWINVQPRSLAAIVRSFKSAATRRINRMRSMRGLRGTPGAPVWQQNYYEHIIRSDAALERVREYLKHNPARWPAARLHPIAPKSIKSIAGAGHAY